jgi:xylan 1,4-beta-xylosidase
MISLSRRALLSSGIAASASSLLSRSTLGQTAALLAGEPSANGTQKITINTGVVEGPIPHIWEECAGSDRAVVGLREQWLSDLEAAKNATGIKSVRFHGLFNDEMGVWPAGAKHPNFLYVDTIFDAMLERGVKPFVELSFMPGALASGKNTIFWYRGNTTPPKDMKDWGELVGTFAKHCVDRYGIQEVSAWKFEVWNEPNIVFWSGTKAQYFELYRQSAGALKAVDKSLQVGGPSTAQAGWVGDLLEFCSSQNVPIDFASTHVYPDDPQKSVFGEDRHYPVEEVIPRAMAMVKDQIKSSKYLDLPLYLTEWSSQNPAFIAHTIKSSIGLAEMMSYWTFDNVFEELGIPKTFLNGSFGLIGMRGIPRPSFNTFILLHRLGDALLTADEGPILATRRKDGSLAVLIWNLIPQSPKTRTAMGDPLIQTGSQYETQGEAKAFTLALQGVHKHARAKISRVDEDHGNLGSGYRKIGGPEYPTAQQIAELKRVSALPEPENAHLDAQGRITIAIPPNGVALLEVS